MPVTVNASAAGTGTTVVQGGGGDVPAHTHVSADITDLSVGGGPALTSTGTPATAVVIKREDGSDLIVISDSSPANGDGRPDGTVYIQTAP